MLSLPKRMPADKSLLRLPKRMPIRKNEKSLLRQPKRMPNDTILHRASLRRAVLRSARQDNALLHNARPLLQSRQAKLRQATNTGAPKQNAKERCSAQDTDFDKSSLTFVASNSNFSVCLPERLYKATTAPRPTAHA